MGNSRIAKNSQFYQQEIWKSSGKELTQFNGKPMISYLISSKFQAQYIGLQYIIQHEEENSQACQQMMMYQLRQCMSHPNVLGVYTFNKGKSVYKFFNKQIDSKKSIYRVITQFIQIRICDMKLLNVTQAIYLFQGAAHGVWQIVKHLGGFTITPQMIGIDNKGNVKVWINSNFAQNTVEFQIQQNFGERQMCIQLFQIFDQAINGNQILPNRLDFLAMETLAELVNYLFTLTQSEGNKEILLQLVLKQKTFNNIQQNSNKFNNSQSIKHVPKYYNYKKNQPNRTKTYANLYNNQLSRNIPEQSIQHNNKQFINENFQRDYNYLHSFPDKPIYEKQIHPLSIYNSQCSPRCYSSRYTQKNMYQQRLKSPANRQEHNSSNFQHKKSNKNLKNKQTTFIQPEKTIKKHFSTTNFQKMIHIPKIQHTRKQLVINQKFGKSELIELNTKNYQLDPNTVDSPTMKKKISKQQLHLKEIKPYQKLPFQTNFIKTRKSPPNNKTFDGNNQKINVFHNKQNLVNKKIQLPKQPKGEVFRDNKNISLNHQNNSTRMNTLNTSVNYSQIKTNSLRSKLSSKEQVNRSSMVQLNKKHFEKSLKQQNDINLFDSKDYGKESYSSIAEEYDKKQQSQIESEILKKILDLPQQKQNSKYKIASDCSYQKKDDSESQKNKSEYLKLSLVSYQQSLSNRSNEPVLQKLHFSKQKKGGLIQKIDHRSVLCLQDETTQEARNKCSIVRQNDFQLIKKQPKMYLKEGTIQRNPIQCNKPLGQVNFTTNVYNNSPTHSLMGKNSESLWQSCNSVVDNMTFNVFDHFGEGCLQTIKQTQRQKDISSYCGEHSDGREFIKDPLTGSDLCNHKIQRFL